MCRRVVRRIKLRPAIALIICAALLSISSVPLSLTSAAPNQPQPRQDKAKPKPGKPEGVWPDLEKVKHETQVEREAPPPIPSTIRSQRNSGKPWDGRRVGDPEPPKGERGSGEPELAKRSVAASGRYVLMRTRE